MRFLREVDRGYGHTGHGTSQTCLFIVKSNKGDPVALYVSYSEINMISKGWTSIERWQAAREAVRQFLESRTDAEIEAGEDLPPWKHVDDGWELWIQTSIV